MYMEPLVTIELDRFNELIGLKKYNDTLLEIARKEMYSSVMEAIEKQDLAHSVRYTTNKPWITTTMPYDEFKKHYINE